MKQEEELMSTQQERFPVAATAWDFAKSTQDDKSGGVANRKRLIALFQLIIGASIGFAIFHYWSQTLAYVVWGIAGTTGLVAFISPLGAYRYIEKAVGGLGWLLGTIMGVLLLVPLYFLFFAPIRLFSRGGKKNAIFAKPQTDSFWVTREVNTESRSTYETQY